MDVKRAPCPECGESISVEANSCRFCHAVLSDKDRIAMLKRLVASQTPAASSNAPQQVADSPHSTPQSLSAVKSKAPVTTGPQTLVVMSGHRRGRPRAANAGAPAAADASQFGMAISSLVIGVIVAIFAIPGGMFAFWLLFVLGPFAVIGAVLGYMGQRSSMGVAGMILNGLALIEGVGFYTYIRWEIKSAETAQIEREKRQADEQNKRTVQENERRRMDHEESEKKRRAADAERQQKAAEFAERNRLEESRLASQRQADIARVEESRRLAEEAKARTAEAEARAKEAEAAKERDAEARKDFLRTTNPDDEIAPPATPTPTPPAATFAPFLFFMENGERIPALSYERIQEVGETSYAITTMSKKVIFIKTRDVKELRKIER